MKKRIILVIIILLVVITGLFLLKKDTIKCPYCNNYFCIQECRESNKMKMSTNWFVCKKCKEIFGKNLNGKIERGFDWEGRILTHSELIQVNKEEIKRINFENN